MNLEEMVKLTNTCTCRSYVLDVFVAAPFHSYTLIFHSSSRMNEIQLWVLGMKIYMYVLNYDIVNVKVSTLVFLSPGLPTTPGTSLRDWWRVQIGSVSAYISVNLTPGRISAALRGLVQMYSSSLSDRGVRGWRRPSHVSLSL